MSITRTKTVGRVTCTGATRDRERERGGGGGRETERETEREGERQRERGRNRQREGERQREICLFGFLTSSSTIRLYCGRATSQSV